MPELVATGPGPGERAQRELPDGSTVRVGRAPRAGWALPWDKLISREHADLSLEDGILTVRCLPTAQNPLVYEGQPVREVQMRQGEEFRIGRTTFALRSASIGAIPPGLLEQQSLSHFELDQFEFGNSERRLELLAKLPEKMAKAVTDEDVAHIVVRLLLQAIASARAVGVVRYGEPFDEVGTPRMMRWEGRSAEETFRPSRRLMLSAFNSRQGVLHIFDTPAGADEAQYTVMSNVDWAYCTPLRDPSCAGWCLYVTGTFDPAKPREQLNGDLRFVEFLADFLGSIRRIRSLEHRAASLSQFFSPAVLETLSGDQAEQLLQPKLGPITILFCDVRGFSRKAEAATSDLMSLFNRVGAALGVMTRGIVKEDGVIADFQGDAALGFWGWPVALTDGPLPACRAALEIQSEFHAVAKPGDALEHFQVGIGLAHGVAVAGRMGTDEQAKVGAFGPVVNLASRLEGMTKLLGASILMDETTAEYVGRSTDPATGRARKLGRFRPYGLQKALAIYELLPPITTPGSLSEEVVSVTEAAVDALAAGQWDRARMLFEQVSAEDAPSRFFLGVMNECQGIPPADWTGAIELRSK